MLSPIFLDRTFATGRFSTTEPIVNYSVESYRHHAIGGPLSAEITATGSGRNLQALRNKLREPLVVKDEQGTPVWWGFVNGVRVGNLGISLAPMYNSIRVRYEDTVSSLYTSRNGEERVTDWATNDRSISLYGRKDLEIQVGEATEDEALRLRDNQLELFGNPVPTPATGGMTNSAVLFCVGWWGSLDWRVYDNLKGKEESVPPDTQLTQTFGSVGGDQEIWFEFSPAVDNWFARSIRIMMRKEGAPTGNIQLEVYDDSGVGGSPGLLITNAGVVGADLEERFTWVEFTLSASVLMSVGSTYWVRLNRVLGPATDPVNYYALPATEGNTYERGDVYIPNTATMVDIGLLFAVVGGEETSATIETIISDAGQFIERVYIDPDSGLIANPYRYDGKTALDNLVGNQRRRGDKSLMSLGTTNNRRYLSTVSPNRIARVFEEPEKPELTGLLYSIGEDGSLTDPYGVQIPNKLAPLYVGNWAYRKIDGTSKPSNISMIERIDYNAQSDRVTISLQGANSPYGS